MNLSFDALILKKVRLIFEHCSCINKNVNTRNKVDDFRFIF